MWRFQIPIRVLLLILSSVRLQADEPFPSAVPETVGVSTEAVHLLNQRIEQLVDEEAIVGAELHVIKGKKTVLHQAFGWADREEQRPMTVGSIHCVRSMTKPLIGTAIQMLVDQGKLAMDQSAADFLTSFDTPSLKKITVEQLLCHSSGLPMSTIRRSLTEYNGLEGIANEAARAGVQFQPGTDFQYSDAGSDTLGAIVEVITGQSAGEYLQQAILNPLKMDESLTLLGDDSRRQRIPSAYSGGVGNWHRHWKHSDHPIFPFFLTSQSLYCSTSDYARFLSMWMDDGMYSGRRMLSHEAISRGLRPIHRMEQYHSGLDPLVVSYGQQWMIYHDEQTKKLRAFGHNGSDGTHAWVWPEQDLIVLFFTQSRGTLAGMELEKDFHDLLVQGNVDHYRREQARIKANSESADPYEGIYWDEDVEDAYYVVTRERQQFVLERPGKFRATMRPGETSGQYLLGSSLKVEFDRDVEQPQEMRMTTSSRTERQRRHRPNPKLPKAAVLLNQANKAHRMHALDQAGVVMRRGSIQMGPLGIRGTIQQWFDPLRSRTEIKMGTQTMVVISDGDDVVATGITGTREKLKGPAKVQELLGHPAVEFGDWRQGYERFEVLKQMRSRKEYLVRVEAANVPGATLRIDRDSGLVVGRDGLQFIPAAGFIGVSSRYGDFRDVGGIRLPFKIETEYANPMLGKMLIQFREGKGNVSAGSLFRLHPENGKTSKR